MTAPRTVGLLGISTHHAGQLLVTAGQNIDRLSQEASFAALCGASPLPVSSGKTVRHRLNPGGDRDANRALYLIAVCWLGCCERTRAYVQRRTREGRSKREMIRCVKRYTVRKVYTTLRPTSPDLADLTTGHPHTTPPQSNTILCGNPGTGITRTRPPHSSRSLGRSYRPDLAATKRNRTTLSSSTTPDQPTNSPTRPTRTPTDAA